MFESYQRWFEAHHTTIFQDLFTFLRFPSISTDPAYQNELLACKDWLVSYLEKMGMNVEVWESSGHPVVFASWLQGGKEAPTLLFYSHYDVQPSVPIDEWESPPFEPEIREGKLYARGAVDNKGQGFYTILGVQAFLSQAKQHRLNIKLLIEGEEETGSSGLKMLLQKKRQSLEADHVFIVDLNMYDERTPAVTLGIRGVAMLNVMVRNATTDLHSGVYGGFLVNPSRALVTAIGKMWDETGQVVIPHFYDGMKVLSEKERKSLDWELDVTKCAEPFAVKAFQKEGNFSFLESNWIRPTLEINGMESGYTGAGSKTIIPSKAMVKLSCRLIEGQNPSRVIASIKSFLLENLPQGLEIEHGNGAEGFITSPHSKAVKVTAEVYERICQVPCRYLLCGATIPIVPMLAKVCRGDLLMVGMGLSTDSMHAPNECFGIDRFEKGFLFVTQILEAFSKGA